MSKTKRAKIERQSVWEDEGLNATASSQFGASFPQEKKPPITIKGMFREEIQAMLYVYGDVRYPLPESVALVEEIVYTQICELLIKAAEISTMRSSDEIGIEEFTFLLRRDPAKLNRFITRMKFMDSHSKVLPMSTDDQAHADIDFNFSDRKGSNRFKICLDILQQVDDSGELGSWATKSDIDETKMKRLERAEKQTRDMDTKEYMEFVKLRRVGFTTKRGPHYSQKKQLRDWFDLDKLHLPVPISEFGWNAIEYLAQETVAELVDLALIVRSETTLPLLHCEIEPNLRHLPVYSSSTSTARADTLGDITQGGEDGGRSSSKVDEGPLNRRLALKPCHFREAMRRFQCDLRKAFYSNSHLSISRKLLCVD